MSTNQNMIRLGTDKIIEALTKEIKLTPQEILEQYGHNQKFVTDFDRTEFIIDIYNKLDDMLTSLVSNRNRLLGLNSYKLYHEKEVEMGIQSGETFSGILDEDTD